MANVSQEVLLEKMASYLRIKGRDTKLADELEDDDGGCCAGFVSIVNYALYLSTTPEKQAYDITYIKHAFEAIARWDETSASLTPQLEADLEYLLGQINFYQNFMDDLLIVPEYKYEDVLEDDQDRKFHHASTNLIAYKNLYHFATELAKLRFSQGEMVRIGISEHVMGFTFVNGQYVFYDSNNDEDRWLVVCKNVMQLAQEIDKGIKSASETQKAVILRSVVDKPVASVRYYCSRGIVDIEKFNVCLYFAAEKGEVALIRQLQSQRPVACSEKKIEDFKALRVAAAMGHLAATQALYMPDLSQIQLKSLIKDATQYGHPHILKFLLSKPKLALLVNNSSEKKGSPLLSAARQAQTKRNRVLSDPHVKTTHLYFFRRLYLLC